MRKKARPLPIMLDAIGIKKHAIEKSRVLKTLPRNNCGE
jgi:hypothetical protein